jgi:signal transduction histidine kinase
MSRTRKFPGLLMRAKLVFEVEQSISGYLKGSITGILIVLLLLTQGVGTILAQKMGGSNEYYNDSLSQTGSPPIFLPASDVSSSTSFSTRSTSELICWMLVVLIMLVFVVANWINLKKLHHARETGEAQSRKFEELKTRHARSQNYLKVLMKRLESVQKRLSVADINKPDMSSSSLAAGREMVISERIIMGHLTTGIVNEIVTPLGFIHNGVETLRLTLEDLISETASMDATPNLSSSFLGSGRVRQVSAFDELRNDAFELMDSIGVGAARLMGIVKKLRVFDSLRDDTPKLVNINEILEEVLAMLYDQLSGRIELRRYYQTPMAEIYLPAGQVSHVLINVLLNAIQAIQPERTDGVITIYTESGASHSIIKIHDNGIGMSNEIMTHIFKPYFTNWPGSKASGLGLSICDGIVKEIKGELLVKSVEGEGTEFEIILPATSKTKTDVS